MIGTAEEWKKYREEFNTLVADAARQDSIPSVDRSTVSSSNSTKLEPRADNNGALWMEVSGGGESSRVGLSSSNVLSTSSDPELAHQLVLARIGRVLKSPKHSRESMVEFKSDWNLLQSVPSYSARYVADSRGTAERHVRRPTPQNSSLSTAKEFRLAIILIFPRFETTRPAFFAIMLACYASYPCPGSNPLFFPLGRGGLRGGGPSGTSNHHNTVQPIAGHCDWFCRGFVKHDNAVHSTVQVVRHLRKQYVSGTYIEAFENRNRKKAYQEI